MEITQKHNVENEEGFILVAALVCLLALTMIGLSLMTQTNIEKEIAHNMNLTGKVFYGADGATETAIEMVEKNIVCPTGWHWALPANPHNPYDSALHYGMDVFDIALAHDFTFKDLPWDHTHPDVDQATLPPGNEITLDYVPSNAARSMRVVENYLINTGGATAGNPGGPRDTAPHTNIAVFGDANMGNGGSPQQSVGYEGIGTGAATGGAVREYELWVQNLGIFNSETILRLGWTHILKPNPECEPF